MVNLSRAVWAVGPITKLRNSPRGGEKQNWRYKCWLLLCRRWNWGVRAGSQDCPQTCVPQGWEIIPVVGHKRQQAATTEHSELCCSSGSCPGTSYVSAHAQSWMENMDWQSLCLFCAFWDIVGQLFCRFQKSLGGYSMERNTIIDKERNL